MLGDNYFRLTDCFACFLAAAKCDQHLISVPFFWPNWLHGDLYPLVNTLFGLPSFFFVLELRTDFRSQNGGFLLLKQWKNSRECIMWHIDAVTQSFTYFLRDRKSPKHYSRIKLIDWFESYHETTLSWVVNAYLCPYFSLDSSGQQRGSRGDVRCNQSTEDNHAGAEDSLLSSRQCWVWSLRPHHGVCYYPWPPVAPGFFRSGRRQGRRWPEGSNN